MVGQVASSPLARVRSGLGGGGRGGRLRAALGAIAAVALAIGVIVGAGLPASSQGASQTAKSSGATTVQRRDLVATDTESGTLSYADPQTVYNRLSGTITWLPSVGQVIKPGHTLYRVDNAPVVLFDGTVPAYRDMYEGVSDGPDVQELKRNLVALGYDPGHQITVNQTFDAATKTAVERWQASLGETQTGTVTLGEAVFLPGPQRITTVDTVLGSTGGGSGSSGAGSGSSGSGSGSGSGNSSAASTSPSAPRAQLVSLTTTTTPVESTSASCNQSSSQTPTPPSARRTKPGCSQQGSGSGKSGGSGNGRSQSSAGSTLAALIALLRAETAELQKTRSSSSGSGATGASGRTAGASPGAAAGAARGGGAGASPAGGASSGGGGAGSGSGSSGGGSTAQAIMQTTSTQLVVTVDLDATKQSEAVVGEPVTVQMPDGRAVNGKIARVSPVAQPNSGSSASGGSGGGSSSTPSATVPVTIALSGQRPTSGLDQAAVSVNFVQQKATGVLSVPVTALLATAGGGYAVQEAASPHRLLPVTPGLFAAGYVQISGPDVYPGLQVTDSQG